MTVSRNPVAEILTPVTRTSRREAIIGNCSAAAIACLKTSASVDRLNVVLVQVPKITLAKSLLEDVPSRAIAEKSLSSVKQIRGPQFTPFEFLAKLSLC